VFIFATTHHLLYYDFWSAAHKDLCSPELTIAENETVFDYVQTFIKLSARFD
jgi:hypothetical protein